jgi:hypothetical protein
VATRDQTGKRSSAAITGEKKLSLDSSRLVAERW